MAKALLGHVGGPDPRMHVALARPDMHLPPRDFLQVGAKEHVGQKQNLPVFGDRADDALGVA